MRRRDPLPRGFGDRAFSFEQAVDRSISVWRLRSDDLRTPFRGVREPADRPVTILTRCEALQIRMPEGGVFSHATAALLHGLPIPRVLADGPLHVSVPRPVRAPRISGVVGHQVRFCDGDVVSIRGWRVTSATRTWRDLASRLSVAESVALGDAIIHWRLRRASISDLARRASTLRGRPGAVTSAAAIPLLHERSESPQESALRVMLVQAGLPRLDVNVPLYDANGAFVARPDLRFPEFRVVIEYEGDHHRSDRAQWRRDFARTMALQDLGETVIRLGAADLVPETAKLVTRILVRAGWSSFAS